MSPTGTSGLYRKNSESSVRNEDSLASQQEEQNLLIGWVVYVLTVNIKKHPILRKGREVRGTGTGVTPPSAIMSPNNLNRLVSGVKM
jgi:hypothetical protein